MESVTQCDLLSWVEDAPQGQKEFRETVHLILVAITKDPDLRNMMVMKGGILMALRYRSERFTKDLDFSTGLKREECDPEDLVKKLAQQLALAVEELDYNLDCRVQSYQVRPSNQPQARFPSMCLKIGHAYKGTSKHNRLLENKSPSVVSIDFSLNEETFNLERLEVGEGSIIQVYAYADLVAEKIRALLQQEMRNRYRRQDIFDLKLLLERRPQQREQEKILQSLIDKAASRDIKANSESFSNPEIKRRAKEQYGTLADELEDPLPDFEESYADIERFYRGLPWGGN